MNLLLFTIVYHGLGAPPCARLAVAPLLRVAQRRRASPGGRCRGARAGTRWLFRSGVERGALGGPATNPPTPPPYPNQLPARPPDGRPPPSPTARRPPLPNHFPPESAPPYPNHFPPARPLHAFALYSAPRSRRPPRARPSAPQGGGLACARGGRRAAGGGGDRMEGAGGRQMEGGAASVGKWGAAVWRLGWAAVWGAGGQLEGGGVGGLVARHARCHHPTPPSLPLPEISTKVYQVNFGGM